MDLKECRKKFDVIVKGKENEGYIEWKKWIEEQVKDCDAIRLTNLCKRCEIKLKKSCIDDGFRNFPIFTQMLSCILIVLPFVGSIVFSGFTAISSVYQEAIGDNSMQEYALIVKDAIAELSGGIVSYITIGASVSVVLLAIISAIDAKIVAKRSNDKIFFEELLEILKEYSQKHENNETRSTII